MKRSGPTDLTRRRPTRRGPPAARPCLEVLEDRCTPSFSSAVSFSVGLYPMGVVTADFNHDGRLDLATVNYGNNTVSVLLGDGHAGLGAANHFATGAAPVAVAVGDFDNDGDLDLATANQGGPDVSVLPGHGNGTFAPPSNTALGSSPSTQSVAVGDFNGDGKMDLGVTSNVYFPGHWGGYYGTYYYPGYYYPGYFEGSANVLLGNGDGSFSTPNVTSLGYGYHASAAAADLNGDGLDDFVTSNGDYNQIDVLLGDGSGYLQYSSYAFTGYDPVTVAAGDVNGDGKVDVATGNLLGNSVSVLLGDGTGGFGYAGDYGAGGAPVSVVLGDFTGDGRIDVATANQSPDSLSVLRGLGGGAFAAPSNYALSTSPAGAAAGDFDGDAFPDVAVANAGPNNVSVLHNTTDWPSFLVSDFPSTTTAGQAHTITVTAVDNLGHVLTGYAGTVTFSSTDGQAGLPGAYTLTTGAGGDNGTHVFTVTLKTADTQSLTVTDAARSDLAGSQTGIVVNPADASHFVVGGFPSPQPAGAPGDVGVIALDAFGNLATGYRGTVHFTSSDPAATLSTNYYTFTDTDNGYHSFSAAFMTPGIRSLTVTDVAAPGITGTQAGIEVTTASTFDVYGFPSPVYAGAAGSFTVVARDVYGRMVPGYRGTVHFTRPKKRKRPRTGRGVLLLSADCPG